MKICPITYEPFSGEGKYSEEGLRLLSKNLKTLADLPYGAEEQRQEAIARSPKMSIQGMQLKLSARLDLKSQSFEIVDTGGHYILKPQSNLYQELPENEGITMRLASLAGVEVPLHGLVYSKDGSRTYFVKRFDRKGLSRKLPLEDFAQLSGRSRDTKYDSSMEKVAEVITKFCTFPVLEHKKLLKLTLVNFLLGNEDMHLKNFSLIRRDGKVELSPAYDLVNSTIALGKSAQEEIALPISGKRAKLSRSLFIEYFADERLKLTPKAIQEVIGDICSAAPKWESLLERSFLSAEMKKQYWDLVRSRRMVLGI